MTRRLKKDMGDLKPREHEDHQRHPDPGMGAQDKHREQEWIHKKAVGERAYLWTKRPATVIEPQDVIGVVQQPEPRS
jgi:hypothetical protein